MAHDSGDRHKQIPHAVGARVAVDKERLNRAQSGVLAGTRARVIPALVLAAGALGTAWLGGQAFTLVWTLAAFAILWEWQRLLDGRATFARLVVGGAALAISAALASTAQAEWAIVIVISAAIGLAVLAGSGSWAYAGAGMLYAGALLIAVLVLRSSLFRGFEAINWLFAIVWGTDIFAYFCGRLVGGPKLWPKVSPAKTWSGFFGGIVGGSVAGVAILLALMPDVSLKMNVIFFLGLALAVVSQGGDLLESAIKRRFHVKDSSKLIPGHGGAMDRLDAFVAAVVCAAILGVLRSGPLNAATGLISW